MLHNLDDSRPVDAGVRDAVRFGGACAALGVGFFVIAAVWMSTCNGATGDGVACLGPQRALLALGGPAILLVGAVWSFMRTYQAWRKRETWWAWQGSGWVLLTLMLLAVAMSLPVSTGPAIGL